MEHHLGVFAPLQALIRKIVIQEGTCGNFQPKTCYPTRFPPWADKPPEGQHSKKYLSSRREPVEWLTLCPISQKSIGFWKVSIITGKPKV
jgi:hypothetical protein